MLSDFSASVSQTGITLSSNGKTIETLPIIDAGQEHRSYILSTWVRSYEPHARRLRVCGLPVQQEVYRSGESRVAETQWEHSRVAVSADDHYTIHAWVCAREGQLWHVYVPPQLRRRGIAKGLVECFAGKEYQVSKPLPYVFSGHTVSYNPYLNGA